MANKIKLGDYNRLRVVKKVDFGMYLDGGDEGEILLPTRYVPEGLSIGDEIDVSSISTRKSVSSPPPKPLLPKWATSPISK